MKRIIGTVVVMLVLLVAGALAFIYSGVYDVAATSKDSALVRWALHTTMERSVERRVSQVQMPANLSLSDPRVLDIGFEHYNEMCTVCHGAPGIQPEEAHYGLNPTPPDLIKHARDMSPRELFWIIKHGVKMTGMPAWGPTHSDDKIWAMVAFVKRLPDMTPADYHAMQERLAGAAHDNDHDH
jgi:mono/diheme cytochrome c family protein